MVLAALQKYFLTHKHGLEKLSKIGVENLAQLWNVRLVGSEIEMGKIAQVGVPVCMTRWNVLLLFSEGLASNAQRNKGLQGRSDMRLK